MNHLEKLRTATKLGLISKNKSSVVSILYLYDLYPFKTNSYVNGNRTQPLKPYYKKNQLDPYHPKYTLTYREFCTIAFAIFPLIMEELLKGFTFRFRGTLGSITIRKIKPKLTSHRYKDVDATIKRAMRIHQIDTYEEARKFVTKHKNNPELVQLVPHNYRSTRGYVFKLYWKRNGNQNTFWFFRLKDIKEKPRDTRRHSTYVRKYFQDNPHLIDRIETHNYVK